MTDNSCKDGDIINCQVGFLRAMCQNEDGYTNAFCDSDNFKELLRKNKQCITTDGIEECFDCLPGMQGCVGFQTAFGGPKNDVTCLPWDFGCVLTD